MTPDEADWDFYRVVVNAERQYAIWRDDRPNPRGWEDAGFSGTKEKCLAYVKKMYQDQQPPPRHPGLIEPDGDPGSAR